MNQAKSRFAAVFAAALALCLVTVDAAEAARRGGGFGSRLRRLPGRGLGSCGVGFG